jgi:hypothetical protein
VHEKLVEHWLTNVNELGYQIPLCEALLAHGYTILHVSRHGRGEHGKDVIARDPAGHLTTFQLKGGDINLSAWRSIRGEVEELVQLPVMLPGVAPHEPHAPILVTNGELTGDAVQNIREYVDAWQRAGYPRMEIWQKGQLLQQFLSAHGSYVPSRSLSDFRTFVELYVADFRDRLPRQRFATFIFNLYPVDGTRIQKRRALESALLTGDYIIGQYHANANHVAALEGWTILAAMIMYAAERDALPEASYVPSLNLVETAFRRSAAAFQEEILASPNLISPQYMLGEDPEVRGARVMLVLGWLTALWHQARLTGDDAPPTIAALVKRELPQLKFLTEADWPYLMSVVQFVERQHSATSGELVLSSWIDAILTSNRGEEAPGMPSPYWLQEQALELLYDKLAPGEKERFSPHTYTVHSAVDMLVRRMCRRTVGMYWRPISKLSFCDFVPDHLSDWFQWRNRNGDSRIMLLPLSKSWKEWRTETQSVNGALIPQVLLRHREWLLPFLLTYPHRANRQMCAVIDAVHAERADLSSA